MKEPRPLLRLPLIGGLTWPVRVLGLAAGGALIAAMAAIQPRLYHDLPIPVLYVVPVVLVAWVGGAGLGIVAALAAATARAVADHMAGTTFSHPSVPWWNLGIGALLYSVLAYLLARLHTSLIFERELARTDPITGLGNRRFFEQVAAVELNRSRRYGRPFALAYLDVDRFKQYNDRHGHAAGDRLLREIAALLVQALRDSDVVARLGGDEFAVILPETPADGAAIAMQKAHERLVDELSSHGISFSIGVITCEQGTATLPLLLDAADRVMYAVKATGRGKVRAEPWDAATTLVAAQQP
jgi:diguanylate cyclase (GGDEF)-like protein